MIINHLILSSASRRRAGDDGVDMDVAAEILPPDVQDHGEADVPAEPFWVVAKLKVGAGGGPGTAASTVGGPGGSLRTGPQDVGHLQRWPRGRHCMAGSVHRSVAARFREIRQLQQVQGGRRGLGLALGQVERFLLVRGEVCPSLHNIVVHPSLYRRLLAPGLARLFRIDAPWVGDQTLSQLSRSRLD